SRAKIEASHAARSAVGSSRASSRYGLSAGKRSPLSGVMFLRAGRGGADRVVQVEPALFPVPLNGPFRYPPHRGDLGERQPAEELQIDDFSELGLDLGQLVERVADANERDRVGEAFRVMGTQRRDPEQTTQCCRT